MTSYKGKIFSGIGVASERVSQNLDTYKDVSGIDLIPGTLNVRLSKDFEIPKNAKYIPPEKIKPLEKKRGVTLVPAKIKGEPVVIMVPEKPIYEANVIEIMASFQIKVKFCLNDGDEIEITTD